MNVKKTTLQVIVFSLFGLFSANVEAQIVKKTLQQGGDTKPVFTQPLTPSGHVRCHTDEYEAELRAKYPERLNTEDFEAWLAPLVEKVKADRLAGRNIQAVYNIPVVIHIVHNGDAIGTGENITDAQARSQINVMNQDYRRLASTPGGANSTGLAVDVEINFCLAQTDPSGNATTGIVRHNIAPYTNSVANGSGGADWELRSDVETMKAATIWDPTLYLNMWTIRAGGNPLDHPTTPGLGGLLGYAQFPSNSGLNGLNVNGGSANTDGVVAAYDAFGTIAENDGTFMLNSTYNLGRTMTHEVGHWLGLRHIWGDNSTCPASNTNTDKDFCADTPAANGPNYTCNLSANSCPSTPGNDMVQNYMDYTNDACMDTFTQEQKNRMIAVMTNSPRRNTLNASTKCQGPTPYIQFTQPTGSINEGTNCSYVDVNFPVSIAKPPSAAATATFTIAGGATATANIDYQIMTPTLTFGTGTMDSQNLTVRVFNDGLVETNETFTINMAVNANGGDALLNPAASTLAVTITDNDVAPTATTVTTLISEDFEDAAGWTILDADGDSNNWGLVNGLDGYGTAPNLLSGACAFSEKNLAFLGGTGSAANPNNFLISPQITIPAGATASTLTYIIAGYNSASSTQPAGNYTVYFATNVSSAANITAGAILSASATIAKGTSVLKTHDMMSFAGQTGYIVYRHSNNNAASGLLLLDTVNLTATIETPVQTAVNVPTQYQATVNQSGTVHAKDASTGKIMASLTSDAFNYGCTNVAVTRDQATAGAAAVNYGSATANNAKVMAKVITVTPTTNNASGNVTIKFYFTDAEVAAWEAATGNTRSMLRIIKDGVATPYSTTLGAFGGNVTLEATFANGLQGTYYFGTDTTLSAPSYEIVNAVTIYPNPSSDVLNISLPGGFDNVKYTVYNSIGQVVRTKNVGTQSDLSFNVSGLSDGIYFIKVEKDGSAKTLRFIKN